MVLIILFFIGGFYFSLKEGLQSSTSITEHVPYCKSSTLPVGNILSIHYSNANVNI
jgi:hypothetical protein